MTIAGAIDIGDVYPASVNITDISGAAANSTAMTLTITLPDQTTVIQTSAAGLTNTTVGTYYYDYTTTLAGKHTVLWVGTGANPGTFEDSFYVEPRPTRGIIGLADAKTFLGLTTTTSDEQLRFFIHASSTAVEQFCNRKFTYRSQTTTFSGSDVLDGIVLPTNAGSITTVVENGVTLGTTDYVLDGQAPILYRRVGTIYTRYWLPGTDNITVTYTVGSTSIPADVRLAVRFMVRELWDDSQRGNAGSGNPRSSDTYDVGGLEMFTPVIRSLLANYVEPGFA